jgi:hypothetical protein
MAKYLKPSEVQQPEIDKRGTKYWWLNRKIHRADGPAIEWTNGNKEWFLNGKDYTFDKWLNANNFISEEEKVMLKLQYG